MENHAGYYSIFQYANGKIGYWLESKNINETKLPAFTYWLDHVSVIDAMKDENNIFYFD